MKKPYSYDFPSLFPGKTQFLFNNPEEKLTRFGKMSWISWKCEKKVSRLSDWLNSEFTTDLYLF